jgi:GNAT superfamily N-acetyltransferase
MIPITLRGLRAGEEENLSRFVAGIFSAQIAPLYTEEGRLEFGRFIAAEAIRARAARDQLCLVAETVADSPPLVGMVELRDHRHVCLLFVDSGYQRWGIGRRLLEAALRECRARGAGEVTVNSSPNSVAAYRKFGFSSLEPEKEVNGIRFVPMKKSLGP